MALKLFDLKGSASSLQDAAVFVEAAPAYGDVCFVRHENKHKRRLTVGVVVDAEVNGLVVILPQDRA